MKFSDAGVLGCEPLADRERLFEMGAGPREIALHVQRSAYARKTQSEIALMAGVVAVLFGKPSIDRETQFEEVARLGLIALRGGCPAQALIAGG